MRFVSKCLRIIGAIAFFGLFSVDLFLIYRWRAVRPQAPQAALGWTERLPWGLGVYGTVGEARLLNDSFNFYLPAGFFLIVTSVLIDYYKFGVWPLRNPPTKPIWK